MEYEKRATFTSKVKAYIRLIQRKEKKLPLVIMILLLITNLAGSAILSKSILQLVGVADMFRYGLVIALGLMSLILITEASNRILKDSTSRFIMFIFILIVLIGGQYAASHYIDRIYGAIDSINKEEVIYSSSFVTLVGSEVTEDTITNLKIGMISAEDNLEGYVLPTNYIKNNNLESTNEIIYYDNFISLLTALYDEELDGVFVSTNYVVMFEKSEGFEYISSDTKIVASFYEEHVVEKEVSEKKVSEPFTLLVMGVDSMYDGLDNSAAFNGDALMVITFNPDTLNATMMSIPRDTYVPIMCFNNQIENKITHAAWYGESCMIDTIENFTGIEIDYYLKINFKGVVNLVDALGGIEVDVPLDFCEQDSNRDFGNQICLTEGEQILDGEAALALARHRKTIGDIQRGLNQQLVVGGMLNSFKSIGSLDDFLAIIETVSRNMDTNMTTEQMLSFYEVGVDIIDKANENGTDDLVTIERLFLSGYDKMIFDEGMGLTLYNYMYYRASLREDVNAMEVNLGLADPIVVKEVTFSINEPYEETVTGQGIYSVEYFIDTVPSMIGKTESYANAWAVKYDVPVETIIIDQYSEDYDESYTSGLIFASSMPHGWRITNIGADDVLTISIYEETSGPAPELEPLDCNLEENFEDSTCMMPDMSSWTYNDVAWWSSLSTVTLNITYIEIPSTDLEYILENANMIKKQSVEAGTVLANIDGGAITVTYYEAAAVVEPEEPEATDCNIEANFGEAECLVPDMSTWNYSNVVSWASASTVALNITYVEIANDDALYVTANANMVKEQSIGAGIILANIEGGAITVTYYGDAPEVIEAPEEPISSNNDQL